MLLVWEPHFENHWAGTSTMSKVRDWVEWNGHKTGLDYKSLNMFELDPEVHWKPLMGLDGDMLLVTSVCI